MKDVDSYPEPDITYHSKGWLQDMVKTGKTTGIHGVAARELEKRQNASVETAAGKS
jgi:hypothetical protein